MSSLALTLALLLLLSLLQSLCTRGVRLAVMTASAALEPDVEVAASPTAGGGISNPTAHRAAMLRPCELGAKAMQCCVTRTKGALTMHPLWTVCLEDGTRFLMSAKVREPTLASWAGRMLCRAVPSRQRCGCSQKRMGKRTSNYLICMDPSGVERKSELVLGKLRSNWVRYAQSCRCTCVLDR
jgi:hypothetical protein